MVALGAVPHARLERLSEQLSRLLGLPVSEHGQPLCMDELYDPQRDQFRSDLLVSLLDRRFASEARVLGVTDADLFIPVLTFVFGEAQLNGRSAVVSTFRLRNELYGLPADLDLLEERLVKEAVHELGHTFGLLHCHNTTCVMQVSTYAEMVDLKPATYCPACQVRYEEFLARQPGGAPHLAQRPLSR